MSCCGACGGQDTEKKPENSVPKQEETAAVQLHTPEKSEVE